MTDQLNKTERFPVTFVQAKFGVQSAKPVDNRRGFPFRSKGKDDASTDPAIGSTFMCSRKFAVGQHVMILDVHEQVTDEAVIAQAAPEPKSESGQRNNGNRDGNRRRDNRGNRKGNHQGKPSGENRPANQGDAAGNGPATPSDATGNGQPREQSQGGERRDQSQRGQRRDGQHKGKRRDGKPNRDKGKGGNKSGRDQRQGNVDKVVWTTGAVATTPTDLKAAGDSIERAKVYVIPYAPKGSVGMGDLRKHFAWVRAQTDADASVIRTELSEVLVRIAALEEQASGFEAKFNALDLYHGARASAERLFAARKEREELKAQQKKLSGERLKTTNRLSKTIKAAGENPKQDDVDALAKAKSDFAKQQEELSAKVAANRLLLDGDKKECVDGLEHTTLWDIGGLNKEEDAEVARDAVMKVIAELDVIQTQHRTEFNRVFDLVRDYEDRLHALAS